MKRKLAAGLTSATLPIFIFDSSSATGAGLGSLVYNTSGLTAEYRRQGSNTWTAISLVTATLGTFTSSGFIADGSLAGAYELGVPDAALAAGARWCAIRLYGAANMLPVLIEIELDAVNYQSATTFINGVGGVTFTGGGTLSLAGATTAPAGTLTVTSNLPTNFGTLAIDAGGNVSIKQITGTGTLNCNGAWTLSGTHVQIGSGTLTIGAGTQANTSNVTTVGAVAGDVAGKVLGGGTGTLAGVAAQVDIQTVKTNAVPSSGKLAATIATGDDADAATMLLRLTASRAGYLDNLNVGGNVASHADIAAINQSASKHMTLATVGQYEGGETYTIEMRTYAASTGAAVNADSTPTLAATGNVSGDLSANLSAATNPATGVYRWTYTPGATPTLEQIRMDGAATIATVAYTLSAYTQTVAEPTAVFTATDKSNLTAIFDKLPANNIADETLLITAIGTPMQAGNVTVGDYATGKDPLTILTGGANQLGVDANGKVQIPQIAGSAQIQVNGPGGNLYLQMNGDFIAEFPGGTLNMQGGTSPVVGDEMDLVDAPNDTAVTAIQNGLATETNLAALATAIGTPMQAGATVQLNATTGWGGAALPTSFVASNMVAAAPTAAANAAAVAALIVEDSVTWANAIKGLYDTLEDDGVFSADALVNTPSSGGGGLLVLNQEGNSYTIGTLTMQLITITPTFNPTTGALTLTTQFNGGNQSITSLTGGYNGSGCIVRDSDSAIIVAGGTVYTPSPAGVYGIPFSYDPTQSYHYHFSAVNGTTAAFEVEGAIPAAPVSGAGTCEVTFKAITGDCKPAVGVVMQFVRTKMPAGAGYLGLTNPVFAPATDDTGTSTVTLQQSAEYLPSTPNGPENPPFTVDAADTMNLTNALGALPTP